MATAYKTPGVYIVEKNAFPPSIVAVATAVPAFVGYTEKAEYKGQPLAYRPFKVTSMSEFVTAFGGPPPVRYAIHDVGGAPVAPAPADAPKPAALTAPTDAQVARVGEMVDQDATQTDDTLKSALKASVAAGTALDPAQLQTLNTLAASAPTKTRDADTAAVNAVIAKVAVAATTTAQAVAVVPAAETATATFTASGTGRYLTRETTAYLLHASMLLFFQNGGGPCWIVSVGDYTKAIEPGSVADGVGLLAGIDKLKDEQEPTMLVIPEAVCIDTMANCISLQQAMLKHCGEEMRNRFAILDIYDGYAGLQDVQAPVDNFRNSLGINNLDFGAAYYPWLNTTIMQDRDIGYLNFIDPADYAASAAALIAVLRPTDVNALKVWNRPAIVIGTAPPVTLEAFIGTAPPLDGNGKPTAEYLPLIAAVTNSLTTGSPVFRSMVAVALRDLNMLPPAAAMAGRYTAVDNTRGVWKAPANVSLNSVISPTVPISDYVQEDLNVTPMGKSINAIRSFIGEGVLVWGARTLDGNSQDWRYINVRRTMIFIEESCKMAAKQLVFEPNVDGTWLTIRAMISNFLTTVWRQGGLAGAVPEDAFVVLCGLGQTMTSDDILDGYLRVTVLVAISRPAEFIEITFQQQAQKS